MSERLGSRSSSPGSRGTSRCPEPAPLVRFADRRLRRRGQTTLAIRRSRDPSYSFGCLGAAPHLGHNDDVVARDGECPPTAAGWPPYSGDEGGSGDRGGSGDGGGSGGDGSGGGAENSDPHSARPSEGAHYLQPSMARATRARYSPVCHAVASRSVGLAQGGVCSLSFGVAPTSRPAAVSEVTRHL
jgi:hypothetical protein